MLFASSYKMYSTFQRKIAALNTPAEPYSRKLLFCVVCGESFNVVNQRPHRYAQWSQARDALMPLLHRRSRGSTTNIFLNLLPGHFVPGWSGPLLYHVFTIFKNGILSRFCLLKSKNV